MRGLLDYLTELQLSGLLTPTADDQHQARQQMFLAMGAGLLGARKGQEGAAIGRAMAAGGAARNQALQDAQGRQLNSLKTASWMQQNDRQDQQWQQQQRQWQAEEERRQAMERARQAGMTPGQPGMPAMGPPDPQGNLQAPVPSQPPGFDYGRYAEALATVDPMQSLQIRQAMAKEQPTNINKVDADKFTPASLARFKQTGNYADLVPQQAPRDQFEIIGRTPDGQMLQRNVLTNQISAVGSPAQRTTINMPPIETEEQKSIGKARGEAFMNLHRGAHAATGRLNNLSAIESLLTGVQTGGLTPAGMKVAGYAKSVGLELDPKLPMKEAADAIANKMALDARSTADGGGMPGAMSDKDREFLRAMNPNVSQTPEGRKLLIEVQRRMAKREQEIARLARDYRQRAGRFDEGFEEVAAQFAEKNPLFDGMPMPGASRYSTMSDAEIKRRLGF